MIGTRRYEILSTRGIVAVRDEDALTPDGLIVRDLRQDGLLERSREFEAPEGWTFLTRSDLGEERLRFYRVLEMETELKALRERQCPVVRAARCIRNALRAVLRAPTQPLD